MIVDNHSVRHPGDHDDDEDADENGVFRDRASAGRRLARRLAARFRFNAGEAVVIGLPRGGVVCAYEVARALHLPLDVVVVRKLGAPGESELGMGAVAEDGTVFVDPAIVDEVGASEDDVERVIEREKQVVALRVRRWRADQPALSLQGKTAIVVDDGVATGGTMRAALACARRRGARRIIVAVPVGAADTLARLTAIADEVVSLSSVRILGAIGAWYDDFAQVDESEVATLLARARRERGGPASPEQQQER